MYKGTIGSIFKQQSIFIIILIFFVNIILCYEILFLPTNSWNQVNELLIFFFLFSLRNQLFTRWGGTCKRKFWGVNAGQRRIRFPFKQSFLFSFALATSHCNNLQKKEMLKALSKGLVLHVSCPRTSWRVRELCGSKFNLRHFLSNFADTRRVAGSD